MGCKPQESLENTIIQYGYTVIGVTPIVPLIQIPKLPGCPAEARHSVKGFFEQLPIA